MNLKSIYHININCTNLERSLEFYKMLGFREVVDFGEGGSAQMGEGLRMPADSAHARGCCKSVRTPIAAISI